MRAALIALLIAATASGADFNSHVRETVMVPMRDGIRLATDVYRPARGGQAAQGRFPVLVARSPYNKNGERARAEFFARNGYVFVAQDCRSFFGSEGKFEPMVREGRDGYDTIEWAAAQPWSNGRVGTTGASYLALVQYAALVENPPHLQAIYAAVGPLDYYGDAAWRGGVPSLGWPIWIANTAAATVTDPERKRAIEGAVREPAGWARQLPPERMSLFAGLPDHGAAYEALYRHPTFDDYWRRPGFWPGGFLDRMRNVPVLLLSGWYDTFAEPTLRLFTALSERRGAPVHVVMGPWPHAYGKRECGDAIFPESTALDERSLQLAWFDRWLRDAGTHALNSPVRYFVMGGGSGKTGHHLEAGGSWKESKTWPPLGVQQSVLYLGAEGSLIGAAPAARGSVMYEFDPADPTPVAGGRYRNGCIIDVDRSALQGRRDIVRFSTPQLKRPMELTGPMSLELNVRTSARDADLIARLIDVWPGGFAAPVAEGQVRLSRRGKDHIRQQVRPGTDYAITLDLGVTALFVPAGHKLRLDIASAAFPALEPNPGTGEDEWSARGRVKAQQTIVTGGRRPSRVVLGVAPVTPR
jgi:uncharacterized protein